MLRTIEVTFVQHDDCRHIIDFAGDQKAVQKRKLHLRKIQRDHKEGAVKVGSDDVRLTGQVGGFADYIVLAGLYCCYGSRIL
jgi:hypothetical protein